MSTKKGMRVKKSKFTVIYAHGKDYLAYNTLTQGLVKIDSELKKVIDQLSTLSPKDCDPETKSNLEQLKNMHLY